MCQIAQTDVHWPPRLEARPADQGHSAQPFAAPPRTKTTELPAREKEGRPAGASDTDSLTERGGLTAKDDGALLAEQADAPFSDVEELRRLIAEGKERGYLSFEEIAACLEEVEITKEQVGELHSHLLDHGVDIVSQDGRPAFSELARLEASAQKDGALPRKVELDLTVEPSLDSLRLYLRSIGRVELLTADQ